MQVDLISDFRVTICDICVIFDMWLSCSPPQCEDRWQCKSYRWQQRPAPLDRKPEKFSPFWVPSLGNWYVFRDQRKLEVLGCLTVLRIKNIDRIEIPLSHRQPPLGRQNHIYMIKLIEKSKIKTEYKYRNNTDKIKKEKFKIETKMQKIFCYW